MTIRLPDPPPQAPPERRVLAGFSGGLDSTVLLHLLATQRRDRALRAIHVHHGLHPAADAWAGHCARVCAGLGVPLALARVAVRDRDGLGPEGAARRARHAAFAAELRDGEILALAHHRDDQAETFLLRALRGSGVDGLGAIPAWRRHARGWLWRPLLDLPRDALLRYARDHGLDWIEDPGNAGTDPDRNYLRHRVLPLLRQRWPQAGAALARSAGLAADASELLADGDARALAGVATPDPRVLDAGRLSRLPAPRRARVLRLWVEDLGLPPLPGAGVARVEADLLAAARGDGAPEFAWAGARIRRWRDLLHAAPLPAPLPGNYRMRWDGQAPLRLPTGDTLVLEAVAGAAPADPGRAPWPLLVHARRGGERILLPGRRHSHSLKHALQALAVPPWVRERLPLLSGPDGVVQAAGDLLFSAGFDRCLKAGGLRLTWSGPDM